MHMQASELNLSLLYSQIKQLHAGTCRSAVDLVLHVLSLCDACRCDVQCCLRTRLSEQSVSLNSKGGAKCCLS